MSEEVVNESVESEASVSEDVVAEDVVNEVSEEVVEHETDVEVDSESEVSEDAEVEAEASEEKLYEVKVDGETLRLPLNDILNGFQLNSTAHKRLKEAAQAQKEARQLQELLQHNPIEAIKRAGVSEKSFQEFVEKYLYEQYKYEEMSPEQKELEDLRRYRAEQEQNQKQRQEQEQRAKQEQEVQFYQEQLAESYSKALETAGVPKSEQAVSRLAQIQLDAMESGWDMPIEMAVDQYVKEQRSLVDSYIQSLDEDQIESVIGKDRIKAIRKKELSKLKNPAPKAKKKEPEQKNTNERISASDFFSNLG